VSVSRIAKLLDHLPELLRRDAAGEPPLFPPADPLQRPRFYVPDLDARPWHDAAAFPWMTRLAEAHDVIRGELDAFLAQQQVTFRDYVGPLLHERADAGEWHVLYLDYRGHRWADNCRMFPRLMELVDQIPRRSGTVFVSRLTAGAHIPAHCGATNTQLTCHFGIVVPEGVELRVARETRGQPQGVCTVFDDSFEHEVWNRAASPRYNLFVQFWHPELSDDDIDGIRRIEQLPQIKDAIAQYLEGTAAMAPVEN
jgi:aspartyl/asparaginyl beta-hydroxylase (cupin superfamily)